MNKENKNEKGMVLVTVIIFGAIIIMLGVALLSTGVMEVKSGNYFENKTQAYYVAKAGADIVAKKIMDGAEVKTYDGTIDGNNTYHVTAIKSGNQITLNSIGTTKGVKDSVELQLENAYTIKSKYVLFTSGKIEIGKSIINGDIGTNSTDEDSIVIDHNHGEVKGTIFIGKDGDKNVVINSKGAYTSSSNLDKPLIYPDPDMPALPNLLYAKNSNFNITGTQTYTMTQDMRLDNLDVSGTLTIDVGGSNRTIRVKNFDISGSLIVASSGSGNLTIHIEDSFSGNNINSGGEFKELKVLYHGVQGIEIKNHFNFCGILQIKSASVDMGNNSEFNGTLISGSDSNISIHNNANSNIVIYAPKANIDIKNNFKLKGSIVGKSFTMKNGGEITSPDPNTETNIPVEGEGASTTIVTYNKLYYK